MVEIDRLYLESGLPYKLNSTVSVRQPTTTRHIGIRKKRRVDLLGIVGRILADPYQNMVWLDDNGSTTKMWTASMCFACNGNI